MSCGLRPARRSALGIANAGAMPIICGSSAWVADATTRASGVTPSRCAASALASTTALAPSESGDELPAVIWVVLGWAARPASPSAVVSSRIASSCSNVQAGCLRVPAISTGQISSASRPLSRAAAACWWERSANASISSRVSP